MKRIHLAMEVVTPAFIGGASPGAEWRAPSVRGMLRFWFRAVAGNALAGSPDGVRAAEEAVFGSTESSSPLVARTSTVAGPVASPLSNRRQSGAEIAVAWRDSSPATVARLQVFRDGDEIPSDPVQYLGYGPFDKGRLKAGRTYLPPGAGLELDLILRRALDPQLEEILRRALALWLLLGGIGSRNRRGFGSLRCVECSDPALRKALVVESVDAFRREASAALGSRPAATVLPSWTHLSRDSSVAISRQPFGDPVQALLAAGSWLVALRRRYGSPHDSRGAAIGQDYSWGKAPDPKAQLPDRAGFGLPLAFERGAVRVVNEPKRPLRRGEKVSDPRRASPLLVHVQRLGAADFRPVLTHLPARYLKPGAALELYRDEASHTLATPPTPRMSSVIQRFLDDLASPSKQLTQQVWP